VRLVGGRWAGTPLVSPGGRVRPTAEGVRDLWLAELAPDLEGATVLDLFAGSGALGLEALSRGAASVDFVENQAAALHALKANVAALRVRGRARVFKRDAVAFLDRLEAGAYTVAVADPPYSSALAERIVRRWLAVHFARVLAVEHAADRALPDGGRRRVYGEHGETAVTTFRCLGPAGPRS
jgi:16S rRNA (guanine966-N2)-methyltransferase